MLSMDHLKDEVESANVPSTLINLSDGAIQIAKLTVMGTLWLYVAYQEPQNFEICYPNVEKCDSTLPFYCPKCKICMFTQRSEYT